MAGGARSSKDKEMASHLRERGVTRTTGQCQMCHVPVRLGNLGSHFIGGCHARRRAGNAATTKGKR